VCQNGLGVLSVSLACETFLQFHGPLAWLAGVINP